MKRIALILIALVTGLVAVAPAQAVGQRIFVIVRGHGLVTDNWGLSTASRREVHLRRPNSPASIRRPARIPSMFPGRPSRSPPPCSTRGTAGRSSAGRDTLEAGSKLVHCTGADASPFGSHHLRLSQGHLVELDLRHLSRHSGAGHDSRLGPGRRVDNGQQICHVHVQLGPAQLELPVQARHGRLRSLRSPPQSYSNLGGGSHTFLVRATDPSGNTDATPASRTWSVDITPPTTTITAGPSGPVVKHLGELLVRRR